MSSKSRIATLGAMLMFAFAVPSFAQNQGGGGGGNGGGGNGGGGGGGGNNRQNYRQQMIDNLKTALGVTDDEWTAMQPKVDKVMQAQREAGAGMFGGRFGGNRGGNRNGGGGGGGGGGNGDANPSAVQAASADLQKTLDDKDAKPEDIKAKLEALRAARKAAKEELVKAQDDLKSILTLKQEAVFVERGTLE